MSYMKGRLSHRFCLFSHIQVTFCFLLLLLTTGCIANRPLDPNPAHLDLGQFKTAAVEVKSDVPKQIAHLNQFELRLQSHIMKVLRNDQTFEKVYPASDAPTDLQIIVTITRIRDVNLLQRELFGVMVGPAQAEATLEFREGATGKALGSCRFDRHLLFNQDPASITSDSIDHLADAILQVIHRNL
jgi:Domain of unknown function (DUF4410)